MALVKNKKINKNKNGRLDKNKIKKYKPGPEVQITIHSWKHYKFYFLRKKAEEELISIIKTSRASPIQKAAIDELSNRAAINPDNILLFDSYIIIIKYSNNRAAREKLVNKINKPLLLEWIIRNCPFEDTRELAKKRLTEVLNRPKV